MGIDSDVPIADTRTELKNAETIEERAKIFGRRYAQYDNYVPFSALAYLPQNTAAKTNGCSKLLYMIATNATAADVEDRIASHPEEVHIVSNQKWTALHMLCVRGSVPRSVFEPKSESRARHETLVKIASLLIQAGANIDAQDAEGFTPLMRVTQTSGPIELFNILMAQSADVNLKNNDGLTALHLYYGGKEMSHMYTQPILDADFDINSVTNKGESVLLVLVQMYSQSSHRTKYMQHIQSVIGRGIYVNGQNVDGNTALHVVHKHCSEVVQLLLESGADPNIRNNKGKTPIMQCDPDYNDSHDKVIGLLLKAGAIDRPHRDCCSLL